MDKHQLKFYSNYLNISNVEISYENNFHDCTKILTPEILYDLSKGSSKHSIVSVNITNSVLLLKDLNDLKDDELSYIKNNILQTIDVSIRTVEIAINYFQKITTVNEYIKDVVISSLYKEEPLILFNSIEFLELLDFLISLGYCIKKPDVYIEKGWIKLI